MIRRVLPLLLAAVALAVFTLPGLTDDKDKNAQGDTHEGKVVRVQANKLIMTTKDGKEHTHTINRDARITLDGRQTNLDNLKPGTKIRVTTKKGDPNTVLKVEALTKGDFEKLNK